jgi:hypothetical protein
MTIKRLPIYQYNISKKCIALDTHSNVEGYKMLSLNDDLTSLTEVTDIENVRKSEVSLLKLQLEIIVTEQRVSKDMLKAGYQFIRIIKPEDLDPKKWLETEKLEELPIAAYTEINAEELLWAGESTGNLQGRVMLYGFICVLALYVSFNRDPVTVCFVALAILIALYVIKTTKWNPPTKASESKILELKSYKQALIERNEN